MTDSKQSFKEKHAKQREMVMSTYRRREKEYKDKQEAFEKYFGEMYEYSSNFELVKTKRSEELKVFVDGFPVESITLNFFENQIKYVGPLPEYHNSDRIYVEVGEHITYSKSGWKYNNQGFKVRVRLNYEDSPYYKTGRTAAKKIIEYVDGLFQIQKHNEQKKLLQQRAKDELGKMFPYKLVDFLNDNTFMIYCGDGIKTNVTYRYNQKDDKIEFSIRSINVDGKKDFQKVIEGLGKI
jgi:hypothetical protein